MGRLIGGVVGGFVISQFVSSIVLVILAFVLGKDGLITADKTPTSTWMAVFLIMAAIGGYIAGAAARWIAKDKNVVKAYVATSIFFTLVFLGWAKFGPMPPEPKQPKETPPEWAQTLMAMGEAQKGQPTWIMLGATAVSLVGVCIGGLSGKGGGAPMPTEKPVA